MGDVTSIAAKIGCTAQSLNERVKKAEWSYPALMDGFGLRQAWSGHHVPFWAKEEWRREGL